MMNRRAFVACIGLLASGAAIGATAPPRGVRIGYLVHFPLDEPASAERKAFLAGMRELGHVEGRNLVIEYRSADGDATRLRDLAAELVRSGVDAIVAPAADVALAAMAATKALPIIMVGIGDPVASGIVANLGRPGGNVTGTAWQTPELAGKRFDLLKELLPRAARVAVVWNPEFVIGPTHLDAVKQAARKSGLAIDELPVRNVEQLADVLRALERSRPDALLVLVDPRIGRYRKIIADAALKQKLPSISNYRGYVDSGGLLSYSADLAHLYYRAASHVDRIIRGAKPGDLPVELPTKYELIVNQQTAKSLGITIPQALLLRADEVIR